MSRAPRIGTKVEYQGNTWSIDNIKEKDGATVYDLGRTERAKDYLLHAIPAVDVKITRRKAK